MIPWKKFIPGDLLAGIAAGVGISALAIFSGANRSQSEPPAPPAKPAVKRPSAEPIGHQRHYLMAVSDGGYMLLYDQRTGVQSWVAPQDLPRRFRFPVILYAIPATDGTGSTGAVGEPSTGDAPQ